MFSLICVWINCWVNNREAGDLRRHRAHYDVIVMKSVYVQCILKDLHRLCFIALSCGWLLTHPLFPLYIYIYLYVYVYRFRGERWSPVDTNEKHNLSLTLFLYIFRVHLLALGQPYFGPDTACVPALQYGMQLFLSLECFIKSAFYDKMHSGEPSFVITPATCCCHCKSLFCYIHKNKIRQLLMKPFHLIALGVNDVKCPW